MRIEEDIEIIQRNSRVCPQPNKWAELYGLLPNKRRTGSGFIPSAPLILGAWYHSNDFQKMTRLKEHIEWAFQNGAFDDIIDFISNLKEED